MHNLIPEYASTASTATVMTMPFYLKRKFLKIDFSPQILLKPPRPQETEHKKKKREKNY
jgi:hypothetical protein